VLATIARSGAVIASDGHAGLTDTLLVISPEHARTIAGDGWTKAQVRTFLWEETRARVNGAAVPKFREAANIHIVVAGGPAGRFSAWIPGWPFPGAPARLVLKAIRGRD
jgi:hypothetical protein